MGTGWPVVWGCLCALVAIGQSAVVPSNEALVISKPYNANPETIEEAIQQTSTECPLAAVKVMELQMKCAVSLRYAHTTVVSLVKNPAEKPQEYTFSILLPETAFISGFQMTIAGKTYKAYVKEKEEAKQIYNDAVSQGLGAAQVVATARDSNQFNVKVNIEGNTSVVFNLTYEELLVRKNGLYLISANINPGRVVPKLSVTVHIVESQKITTLRVPEITTGNEIIPTESGAQNTKAVITRASDDREAKITFTPDLDTQMKLMEIYAQKAKESEANPHKQIYLDGDDESKLEGNIGQFVVQYDVDREVGSEILVNDGYFVHFFAPRSLRPMPKLCVFVLDTSGSMSGRKITQLQEAMHTILGDLHPGDYFALIEFASGVKVHDLTEADKPAPPKPAHYVFYEREQSPKLVQPFKATPENKAKAKIIITGMTAVGGTNIAGALNTAIDIIDKSLNVKEDPTNETVAEPVTQTEASSTEANQNEKDLKDIKPKPKPDNDDIKKELKNLQPIIIFLTDGEPTVGETNPKRIASNVFEKNVGEFSALLFALSFGNGADRKFLRTMSLQNKGFTRQIYEGADATSQILDFYQQISSPLIANVTFVYPPNQVKRTTKTKFRTYFQGTEMVVAGKVDPSTTELTSQVSGFCGVDDGFGKKRYEIRPKGIVPKKEKENDEYLPLERLWSYLTIKQLLEERNAAEEQDKTKEEKEKPEKEALELALKYSFVTELTSLVVVKPNDTKTVNAESVDGSNISPSGAPLSSPHYQSGASQFSAANFAPSAFRGGSSPLAVHRLASKNVMKTSMRRDKVPLSTAQRHPTPVAPIEPPKTLATYHLEQHPWTQSLLDFSTDELKLLVNGVSTSLKLTKDVNVPQTSSPCSRATNGGAGLCVYLTRCDAARNISAGLYQTTFCMVDGSYAGVCCPKACDSETDLEDEQSESECDAESNDQLDNIDSTSDDVQSQKDDDTTKVDTNSNDNSGSSDTQNENGEILNDEAELTPQNDESIDDDTDSNDDGTIKTKLGDLVDGEESINDNPAVSGDENDPHSVDDLTNQEQIIANEDDS